MRRAGRHRKVATSVKESLGRRSNARETAGIARLRFSMSEVARPPGCSIRRPGGPKANRPSRATRRSALDWSTERTHLPRQILIRGNACGLPGATRETASGSGRVLIRTRGSSQRVHMLSMITRKPCRRGFRAIQHRCAVSGRTARWRYRFLSGYAKWSWACRR